MQQRLTELAIINQLTVHQGRYKFIVQGRQGCAFSADQGVLIAIHVAQGERTFAWLQRVTLLLVAHAPCLEQGLQVWQNNWWLWQRYPSATDREGLEQGMLLQHAVATLLDQQNISSSQSAQQVNKPDVAWGKWA